MSLLAYTRPRRATEIVDASFRFYREHAGDLLVVSALLLVPPALLAAIAPDVLQWVFQIAYNLMYIVSQGVIAVYVAAAVERDSPITAGRALREVGNRAGNVLVVGIMAGILMAVGFVLLLVPGFIALGWFAAAIPVAAIEGLKHSAALGRSRQLARNRLLHVLGTLLLVWLIVVALVFGGALGIGLVFAIAGVPERLIEFVSNVLMIPLFPLAAIATTMLYYDLRVRNDGADVMAMVEELPGGPVPVREQWDVGRST